MDPRASDTSRVFHLVRSGLGGQGGCLLGALRLGAEAVYLSLPPSRECLYPSTEDSANSFWRPAVLWKPEGGGRLKAYENAPYWTTCFGDSSCIWDLLVYYLNMQPPPPPAPLHHQSQFRTCLPWKTCGPFQNPAAQGLQMSTGAPSASAGAGRRSREDLGRPVLSWGARL